MKKKKKKKKKSREAVTSMIEMNLSCQLFLKLWPAAYSKE